MVLRRIFGPKKDEIISGWRIFHNEELPSLCSLHEDEVKEDEMDEARMQEKTTACRILVGKPERKRTLGRSSQVGNIKDGWYRMGWYGLDCCAQNDCFFFLYFFHLSVFWGVETRRFGNWICFRPQVKGGRKHLLIWVQ
jgi:hypothetical protein